MLPPPLCSSHVYRVVVVVINNNTIIINATNKKESPDLTETPKIPTPISNSLLLLLELGNLEINK